MLLLLIVSVIVLLVSASVLVVYALKKESFITENMATFAAIVCILSSIGAWFGLLVLTIHHYTKGG